jgi:hypothetical protein
MIQPRRLSKAESEGEMTFANHLGRQCACRWISKQMGCGLEIAFEQKKDAAMTGKDAPPEVRIRSYRDSPICDVVVVVRGTEMVLRCRDYRQAMRWARIERKTYKIPEPDIDVADKAESRDLPLFLAFR